MSSELEVEFNAAAEKVKTWKPVKGEATDDEKLLLYALFKQATVGDCDTKRPGMFDFTGRRKWDAWNAKKGMSKEDAMRAYTAEIKRQIEVYGE